MKTEKSKLCAGCSIHATCNHLLDMPACDEYKPVDRKLAGDETCLLLGKAILLLESSRNQLLTESFLYSQGYSRRQIQDTLNLIHDLKYIKQF